jgi:hypothetical protein
MKINQKNKYCHLGIPLLIKRVASRQYTNHAIRGVVRNKIVIHQRKELKRLFFG